MWFRHASNACGSSDKAIVNCIGAGHCGCLDWLKRNPGAPTWIDHAAWLRGDAAEDAEAVVAAVRDCESSL